MGKLTTSTINKAISGARINVKEYALWLKFMQGTIGSDYSIYRCIELMNTIKERYTYLRDCKSLSLGTSGDIAQRELVRSIDKTIQMLAVMKAEL